MIEVTIYEGEFEDVHLSKYVDKLKYYDSVKERLKRGEVVRYRDYEITFKKRHRNSILYTVLDYDDTVFIPYITKNELGEFFNLDSIALGHMQNQIGSAGFKDIQGYRVIKAEEMS